MSTPNLEQTQRLLWQLITAPEGAAAGLASLDATERAVAESLVCGDPRLSPVERIDIYADMYFYRIRDCLKEDFAATLAVVGETHFHNLITDYLLAHSPSHFSLRYAGQHVPAFVAAHPLSAQCPYLHDLARLEWAILEAFDAPDGAPLESVALAEVPEDRWPEIRFRLAPSLQLLDATWPVHDIWERVQRGEAPGEMSPQSTALRVWRQDFRVFHRAIDAVEMQALTAVAGGASFAEACERIIACIGEATGAERAFSLVGGWLADELLTGWSLG